MNRYKINGFGLIEVLVAMFILAGGLLAIANFQGSLINESSDSKNKSRAAMIAKERIEQMRNYTKLAYNEGDFNDLFPETSEFANSTTFQGISANFLRQEKISNDDGMKNIVVHVSWESAAGVTEVVTMDTTLTWQSPALSAKLDTSLATGPMVRSATGRARLGKGQITDSDKVTYSNDDTTGLVDRGDGDLRLTSGEDVVLTLEDACEIENNSRTSKPCTGFVEVSGTVYIDRATTSTPISDFYVIASDAAYCQRYWIDETEANADDQIKAITNSTSQAEVTANGDYEYFYYTCYLGGGWHGNIGVLADGPEWACLGDPTSANAFEQPAVAIRRVYRGMAFNYETDGVTKVTDDNNDTIYYSIGVADALILPPEGGAGHDFVLANLSSSDSSVCISDTSKGNTITKAPMKKNDSNVNGVDGDLFAGVPTDFFCLNQNADWVDQVKLEAFDYSTEPHCPFDPSDPPSATHIVSGIIDVVASFDNLSTLTQANILTSDGFNNCTVLGFSYIGSSFEVNYQCNVYDWGNGWNGYVQITPDLSVFTCDTTVKHLSGVTTDQTISTFACTDGSDAIDPDPDPDPEPEVTTETVIVGNLIKSGGGAFGGVYLDGARCSDDGETYTCTSAPFVEGTYWSGTVTFEASKKVACPSQPNSSEDITANASGVGTATATYSLSFTDDTTKDNIIGINFTFANGCN